MRIALKSVFALSLVSLAFTATYTSSKAAFSESDFHSILLLGGALNTGAVLGALLLPRSVVVANAILSLIVSTSVATAYVIHTDLYLTGYRPVLVLLGAMFCAALFVAFRIIDERRLGGAALSAAALLGLGAVVGGNLSGDEVFATGDLSNIRDISFQKRPNLYFVSFDSAAPRSILKKYLGLETTEFHDTFDAHFRRFPNLFADSVRTTHSLNTLLALDVDVYNSQRKQLHEMGKYPPNPYLFSGQNPSPLLAILHKNGYETTSIFANTFFGRHRGPYIDNYITFMELSVCNFLDDDIRSLSFWGYCLPVGNSVDWTTGTTLTTEQVTRMSGKDGPQFVMAHLNTPGHTDRAFRYTNAEQVEIFRDTYLMSANRRAASSLKTIVRHLEENDPDAVAFVYGDHGPFLSQGLEFEDNAEFVVQDHYGILGGVYPRDTCATWFDEASAQGFMTVLDVVHTLLRCLSGGESALVEATESGYRHGPIPWGAELDFREFLYE